MLAKKLPPVSTAPSHIFSTGYTLLEILIGLTIIGLIFSLGFVSFRDFSRRQQVVSARRRVDGELRLAQERALSGEKPSSIFCDDPNSLDGYYFRVVTSTNYVIEVLCTGGTVEIRSTDLPEGVSISTPSPNPILFKVLGHGTNIPSGETTLTLTQTETGDTQTITVTASGEIK